MKIPIGTKVTVDLWDSRNRRGMVKHTGDTLSLLRAESDFSLDKGQGAIVVKSYENFVKIIPADEFSKAITGTGKDVKVDKEALVAFILTHLYISIESTGGIASILDLFHFFKQTSLNEFITLDKLYKISKMSSLPFECISDEGNLFFVLPDSERTQDCRDLIALAKEDPVLSVAKIRHRKHWSDLRIRKTLNYMVKKKFCRFESSYKDGEVYFFPKN
ncbi:MAG: hypothetical protein EU530_00325 [Promethearchaeota archaeon]|nr:MAG: hypothetical protein EU530_00325 [Candidatus Lokiarchaeota archaeon]